MRRIYGKLAVFLGWLCFMGSIALGLIATETLGLHHVEGPPPLSTVYGIPEVFVMWIILAAGSLGSIPIATSIASPNPRPLLYGCAVGMTVASIVLLQDELGRVHALAFLPGALLFYVGGYILGLPADSAPAAEPAAGAAETRTPAAGMVETRTPALATPAPAPVPTLPAAIPAAPASTAPAAPASTAAPSGRSATRKGRKAVLECPWCSATNAASAAVCQGCGAALHEAPDTVAEEIPGLTIVAPKLIEYERATRAKATKKTGFLAALIGNNRDPRILDPGEGDAPLSAFEPPSRDVKLEMARLAHELPAPQPEESAAVPPPAPAAEPASAPKRSGRDKSGSGA